MSAIQTPEERYVYDVGFNHLVSIIENYLANGMSASEIYEAVQLGLDKDVQRMRRQSDYLAKSIHENKEV